MLNFAVVEISGRQYKIEPGKSYQVDFLGDIKTLECDKVIAKNDEKGFTLGNPYLKDRLVFEIISSQKDQKIRVATYKAKANTRRVKGSRRIVSNIKLAET